MERKKENMDGNAAAAHVAYATNEVIAIYPITPSSPMGEIADEKASRGEKNIWGTVPHVIEMQSEGGASGAVHGSLTTGALTTTFTASQGLLLMIPNMFKIAGELTPAVFHVSARSVACQALSIFGDHTDVMATRSTGWAMLASSNPQEVMDFALIAQASTLEARVPFVHFFDGFRTSHEIQKIEVLSYEDMKEMIEEKWVRIHRERALNPENPTLKGTSQNPDVFFQGRETVNKYYLETPKIVRKYMEKFAKIVGRKYDLFEYVGAEDAEYVIVIMASGADTVHETVEYLVKNGEKVGVVKVRLYRPFSIENFLAKLPSTVKGIAAMDRTKEPGSIGEPLYQDVVCAVEEGIKKNKFADLPIITGGRYGLGSKEFTPSMVKAIFDNLKSSSCKKHFTVGINDDITGTSLNYDKSFSIKTDGSLYQAMFYGLGSDGTVGANKNSIKIIGELTDNFTQGYFVYDSKKAGAVTVSHLRFGNTPIRKPYLIENADFLACHQFPFIERFDMLSHLKPGGIFLLESPFGPEEVWDKLPMEMQQRLVELKQKDNNTKFFVLNAKKIAKETGLGGRINVIMQTAFFYLTQIIPQDKAITAIKDAIKKTYGKKGEEVVAMNIKAVDMALNELKEVEIPDKVTSTRKRPSVVPENAPEFVKNVTAKIIEGKGDELPVSSIPADGTWPTGTTQYEKRNIAYEIPVWNPDICTQCTFCSVICPHSAIRAKAYDRKLLEKAPSTFKYAEAKPPYKGKVFTIQVAPEDCTGCGLCVHYCPAVDKASGKKALTMSLQLPLREQERKNWDFFLSIPQLPPEEINIKTIKGSQMKQPLFEFSGACPGCGETPYIKLLTQLFGDRMIIANATGCSSIYGGNLPTTPYCKKPDGRGPAWSNSLFEDNAEFGLGMRLAVDKNKEQAYELIEELLKADVSSELKALLEEIKSAPQEDDIQIEQQRERVAKLKKFLKEMNSTVADRLLSLSDYLIEKSVWIIGGDGWAYDIGYGGLDHVLASGRNVNVLVLDTEVYSNTGGQMSKATPIGATARFAMGGKPLPKKDLGMIAMTYGNVYVAQVAIGANPNQTLKAFLEANAYKGPSLVIAYSNCIAHGINMTKGTDQQKMAVSSGHWILYRFNPLLAKEGKNPLTIDSKAPTVSYQEFAKGQVRFNVLSRKNPEVAEKLFAEGDRLAKRKYNIYKQLSELDCNLKE